MSDAWTRADEMADKIGNAASTWLKLVGDGDKEVVTFCGDPYPMEVAYIDGKPVPYTTQHEADGLQRKFRVAINVRLNHTGEVKVWEMSGTTFKTLKKVKEKYGLDRWAFEIARQGAPKDTSTTYSIMPEEQLRDEDVQAKRMAVLHDLAALYSGASPKADGPHGPPASVVAQPPAKWGTKEERSQLIAQYLLVISQLGPDEATRLAARATCRARLGLGEKTSPTLEQLRQLLHLAETMLSAHKSLAEPDELHGLPKPPDDDIPF